MRPPPAEALNHERTVAAVPNSPWWTSLVHRSRDSSALDRSDIYTNMSQYDPEGTREHLGLGKCPGTTNWLLDDADFQTWLHEPGNCFVLSGIMGSGKTKTTTTVIDFLSTARSRLLVQGRMTKIVHFFYQKEYPGRLSALDVVEALIKQVVEAMESQPSEQIQLRMQRFYGHAGRRGEPTALSDLILVPLAADNPEILFVIDGVDACDSATRPELLRCLELLVKQGSKAFVTSRDHAEITRRLPNALVKTITEDVGGVQSDLDAFIDHLLEEKQKEKNLITSEKLYTSMQTLLKQKADTMFLWVKLTIQEIWHHCSNGNEVMEYLQHNLPRDLEAAYRGCRDRVPLERQEMSTRLLQMVSAAAVPMHEDALRAMVNIDETNDCILEVYGPEPAEAILLECGANLIYEDRAGIVHLVHHSVAQHVFGGAGMWSEESEHRQFQVEARIGKICVYYLKAHISTDVILARSEPVSKSSYAPLSFVSPILPESLWKPFRPMTMPKSSLQKLLLPSSFEPRTKAALLSYVQRSWLHNNRQAHLLSRTRFWAGFLELLDYRQGRVPYPWRRGGPSQVAHISDMFMWAVTNAHMALMHALIETPTLKTLITKHDLFNLPFTPPRDGFALHFAAKTRNVAMFSLVARDADMFKLDMEDNTPLHLAALHGCSEITGLYLDIQKWLPRASRWHMANIAPRAATASKRQRTALINQNKQSPFHSAVLGGNISCIQHVLTVLFHTSQQADWPCDVDHKGNTPLDYAVDLLPSPQFDDIVKALPAFLVQQSPFVWGSAVSHIIKSRRWDNLIVIMRQNLEFEMSDSLDTLVHEMLAFGGEQECCTIIKICWKQYPRIFDLICANLVQSDHRNERVLCALALVWNDGHNSHKMLEGGHLLQLAVRHGNTKVVGNILTKMSAAQKQPAEATFSLVLAVRHDLHDMVDLLLLEGITSEHAVEEAVSLRKPRALSKILSHRFKTAPMADGLPGEYLARTLDASLIFPAEPEAGILRSLHVARILLEQGTDSCTSEGLTTLLELNLSKPTIEASVNAVVELLVCNLRLSVYWTRIEDVMLWIAIKLGFSDLVLPLILKYGADPNATFTTPTSGVSPEHGLMSLLAWTKSRRRLRGRSVELLLVYGALEELPPLDSPYAHNAVWMHYSHRTFGKPPSDTCPYSVSHARIAMGLSTSDEFQAFPEWQTKRAERLARFKPSVVWVQHSQAAPKEPMDTHSSLVEIVSENPDAPVFVMQIDGRKRDGDQAQGSHVEAEIDDDDFYSSEQGRSNLSRFTQRVRLEERVFMRPRKATEVSAGSSRHL